MLQPVKISIVSYLNSKPFLYGLQHSSLKHSIELAQDSPAVCAKKLIEKEVDLGLVPVAILPQLEQYYIVSDYCIGAQGKVSSVMLYSDVPLNQISKILLDYQSKTSVTLVKILARELWEINPAWENASANFEQHISGGTAAVIIGDRTFGLENKYPYSYDLSEEWEKLTGLPFVFACWVSNKKLSDDFIQEFNNAIKYGLDNRNLLVEEFALKPAYSIDVAHYLNVSIQYNLDEKKREAMRLFLNYLG